MPESGKGRENISEKRSESRIIQIAAIGIVVVAIILIAGSIWMGRSASRATEEAVHNVSLFYLNELAGRREQVVANNLETNINNIRSGIALMDKNDLDSIEHLQAYQAKMKKLYGLEKFAFVDDTGLIYTALGTQTDIENYPFDYKTLKEPVVAIKGANTDDMKVIIAIPLDKPLPFNGRELVVCFEEIDMDVMLKGVSMESSEEDATFCNIYTADGVPLSNKVLGGLGEEDNLAAALSQAEFAEGYSLEQILADFAEGRKGVSTFEYHDVPMTLYYVPVEDTGLMLTYLVQESLIGERIQTVTNGIIKRSVLQTVLTALVLLAMFILMIVQLRRSSQLIIEKERTEAESRIRQDELEQKLALQEKLLEQEKEQARGNNMITALAADYRSVYYINLDKDKAMCYRSSDALDDAPKVDEIFDYMEKFTYYGDRYVDEAYRDEFKAFIQPESIRKALEEERIISFRYLAHHDGEDIYELLRMTGVRNENDPDPDRIYIVGAGFANVDRETRDEMDKRQALSDALAAAEEASKAKTTFLSNMSHEIRTPMNAIIGLDNIALSDPEISDKTRDHLEKIDSSAKHLLSLINDILDMSRIESGRMILKNEEFSFSRMLEQINTMVSGQCSDKGITYHCRINGEIDDSYIGDDMKLRQVIINILGNAVKFTPEGGEINFTVERTAQFDGQSTLLLTMQDTGIGMDQEFLPRLFDAFSQEDASATSRYGSSGLGLAITKNIVEMMNGDIRVESEKNVGTTFRVTVTLQDAEKDHSAAGADRIDPHEMSVLIVDDDPVACEHARLILEKVGISADVVMSGPAAIEMVQLRYARQEPYNLILVDWKMPEMDGVETTRRIRAITGDASAIVILTAYRWDDILEEAMEAGVDSFLSKPLFANNVIEEFQRSLTKKQAAVSEENRKADLKGRRILLAEDMPVNAEIIVMLLSMRESEVDLAENGRIAVEKFESHPEHYYDAILMDMRMPEMDGLTATKTIRAMDRGDAKTIPIIALTANAFDDDVQRSLQAGLNAHLTKPVEPAQLFSTLESFIRDN